MAAPTTRSNGEFQRRAYATFRPGSKPTPDGWARDILTQWLRDPTGQRWIDGGGDLKGEDRKGVFERWCEAVAKHLTARPWQKDQRTCRISDLLLERTPHALTVSLSLDEVAWPEGAAEPWRRSFNGAMWMAVSTPGRVSAFIPYVEPSAEDVRTVLNALRYAHAEAEFLMACFGAHPSVLQRWTARVCQTPDRRKGGETE